MARALLFFISRSCCASFVTASTFSQMPSTLPERQKQRCEVLDLYVLLVITGRSHRALLSLGDSNKTVEFTRLGKEMKVVSKHFYSNCSLAF
jgi:hypothetical protein